MRVYPPKSPGHPGAYYLVANPYRIMKAITLVTAMLLCTPVMAELQVPSILSIASVSQESPVQKAPVEKSTPQPQVQKSPRASDITLRGRFRIQRILAGSVNVTRKVFRIRIRCRSGC